MERTRNHRDTRGRLALPDVGGGEQQRHVIDPVTASALITVGGNLLGGLLGNKSQSPSIATTINPKSKEGKEILDAFMGVVRQPLMFNGVPIYRMNTMKGFASILDALVKSKTGMGTVEGQDTGEYGGLLDPRRRKGRAWQYSGDSGEGGDFGGGDGGFGSGVGDTSDGFGNA